MVKKVFAVTNIKGSDVWVEAGQPLVTAQFTREELKNLMDNGAIEVRDVADEGPDTTVVDPEAAELEGSKEPKE